MGIYQQQTRGDRIAPMQLQLQHLEKRQAFDNLQLPEPSPMVEGIDYEPLVLDLSQSNPDLDPSRVGPYSYRFTNGYETLAIGGYLEKRNLYEVSDRFGEGIFRNIHLGIDIWVPPGRALHCPLDATLHAFEDRAVRGDYGPTIILEHTVESLTFYSLYGHLDRESLAGLRIGQDIKAGHVFCRIGQEHENGGWPPHAHVQLILDLLDMSTGFPGVCYEAETSTWATLCPDPANIVRF